MMSPAFTKNSQGEARKQLENEMAKMMGPGTQVFISNTYQKREELNVITPTSGNWKKKDQNLQNAAQQNKDLTNSRKSVAMVDIR